jgi:hypothetical protein
MPLERSQNLDIYNDLASLIWNYELKVMMKKKVGDQISLFDPWLFFSS